MSPARETTRSDQRGRTHFKTNPKISNQTRTRPHRQVVKRPEVFAVEQRDAINARRMTQWSQRIAAPAKPQHLMLLIGEVKEIVPARYGFKSVVKDIPDQGPRGRWAVPSDERSFGTFGGSGVR